MLGGGVVESQGSGWGMGCPEVPQDNLLREVLDSQP